MNHHHRTPHSFRLLTLIAMASVASSLAVGCSAAPPSGYEDPGDAGSNVDGAPGTGSPNGSSGGTSGSGGADNGSSGGLGSGSSGGGGSGSSGGGNGGGSSGGGSGGGSGSGGGGSSGGNGKEYSGLITLSQDDSASGSVVETAYGYFVPGSLGSPSCNGPTAGACCLEVASSTTPTGGALMPIGAGSIALSDHGLLGTLEFTPGSGYSLLESTMGSLADWTGGDVLSLSAAGDTVASFQGSVTTPESFASLSPPYDTVSNGPVPLDEDLVLTWAPGNATKVVVLFPAGGGIVTCTGDDSAGTLTIPSSMLAYATEATIGSFQIEREILTTLSGSNVDVSVEASYLVATSVSFGGCGDVGWPCQEASTCCSQTCTNGSCATSAVSGGCHSNADCGSDDCQNGACVCARPAGQCAQGGDCCSGNCVAGKCVASAFGGTCQTNVDCTDSGCINGTCGCLTAGASCGGAGESDYCCSGGCGAGGAGTCDQSYTGDICRTNADCTSQNCKVTGSGPYGTCVQNGLGGACLSRSDCTTSVGDCADGICCMSVAEVCTKSSDCCSGASCTKGTCS